MKCIDNELILKFINNTVNEKQRNDIENHLSECPYCLDIYETASLYIKENNSMQFEPLSPVMAKNIIQQISPVLQTDTHIKRDEAKQQLLSNFKNVTMNIKNAGKKFHKWLQQSITFPEQIQWQLSPVNIRSAGISEQNVYDSIVIQKELPDITIEICLIKNENDFHILAKIPNFEPGQSLKRLSIYKNNNLITSSPLKNEYQYLKKQLAGNYKFVLGFHSFELEISDEKLCER
jgi:hypothetical protein